MEVGRGERWIVGSGEAWVLALLRDVIGEDGPSVVCQRGEGVCHWQQGREAGGRAAIRTGAGGKVGLNLTRTDDG